MSELYAALARISVLQRESLNLAELNFILCDLHDFTWSGLEIIANRLNLPEPRWSSDPMELGTPSLVYTESGNWNVFRGMNGKGEYVVEVWSNEKSAWLESAVRDLSGCRFGSLRLTPTVQEKTGQTIKLIWRELQSNRGLIIPAIAGSVAINLVALATSLYSMQVYDRVVPTGAAATLLTLTLGVFVAMIVELAAKKARSNIYEHLIERIDRKMARGIYSRFLSIRLDQMPQNVGSLASQMRGYETVRAFLSGITAFIVVDAPFAVFFVLVIFLIAGGVVAAIPAITLIPCVLLGLYYKNRIERITRQATQASNYKTGLLVESVEGAETIKAGQANWRMLNKWLDVTDQTRQYDMDLRRISEQSGYLTAFLQQSAYVMLVAIGALVVSRGDMSMGALIACSILSGRILAPVAAIPGQIIQWGHAKAAVGGLDQLWALEGDHHGIDTPIVIENFKGDYVLEKVMMRYGRRDALAVSNLHIRSGEKIGVLGPVGSGKTSLLRLLSGMYKPQEGRVTIDGVDMSHVSKPLLAERMAYVQQDGRLFAGTLRENLVLGLMDPGDELVLNAAKKTGLFSAVIADHPKGVDQEINEGGTGLSGGQRQLVNLTRAILREPEIWLLDEPTASIDRGFELQVRNALSASIKKDHTVILVTHKPEMLDLVDRLIVVSQHQIVLDGTRDSVLQRLRMTNSQENGSSPDGTTA